ncbi:hypothetical protein [Staphylococcus canis]|uniref:Group-specific protein n=1 Tax=Staphylococcus canis TaxID=2724942 RepID=A0ABS0T7G6_9STAP|nr:hypothetical protein [Staphylococcus canis]MBI5974685.1 hypothetical protein [Staphylococcus canis]
MLEKFEKLANHVVTQVIALIISIGFVVLSLMNIIEGSSTIKVVLSILPLIVFSISGIITIYNIKRLVREKQ